MKVVAKYSEQITSVPSAPYVYQYNVGFLRFYLFSDGECNTHKAHTKVTVPPHHRTKIKRVNL